MRGLLAHIGLLLVVTIVEKTFGEVIHTQVGRSVTIKGPYLGRPLERCSVEHNGINYGLYPKLNLTGAEFAGSPRFCSFIIKWIDFDHAGEWIIKTIWGWDDYSDDVDNSTLTVNRYTDYTIHVRQDDAELAFEGVTDTESGSYATIHFKDYFNKITKCYIVQGRDYGEIRYILSDNSNGISTGLYRNGKCGVRIPINDEYSGKWELVQESGDDKITTGIFTIWPDSSTKSSEELHKNWRRGSKNKTIRINKYGIHWYCELERPDGMKESLIDSQCEYSVKRVSEEHAGTWKLRYASKYSTNILEQRIVVNVYDPPVINATVSTTKRKRIHILCQAYVDEIEYCLFTKPNGVVINVAAKNENEKYICYGDSFHASPNRDFTMCGITILQPSDDDYGLWKCAIKDAESHKIMNASVSTAHLSIRKANHPNILTENVDVKLRDKFSVKCTTHASLDYCWFQSPKGEHYTVTKNRDDSHHSSNVNKRLADGICERMIEEAEERHSGKWTCGLGVTGSAEIQSTFPVTITGELFHAKPGDSISFSGPHLDRPLEQCIVEHNGTNYSLYPKLNLTGATFAGSSRFCTFFIKWIDFEHAGEWKVKTIWGLDKYSHEFSTSTRNQKVVYTNYAVYVKQEANKLAFKNVIDGEDGSYIAVFFNEYFHNVTKCYAVKKTDHDEISYILTDNGIASAAELKLHNKCGVQIPLSNEWTGQWTLVQESGSYKIRSGFISIGSQ